MVWKTTFRPFQSPAEQLLALIYTLAAPRIPDVRSGAAAAKLVREGMGTGDDSAE